MKPVFQTRFGTHGEDRGDCFRACVASILELPLEAVPDFAMADDYWNQEVNAWLNPLGWHAIVLVPTEGHEVADFMGQVYSIGGGVSPRDDSTYHAVVLRGAEIVHDPSPGELGLKGKLLDLWVLLPADPARFFSKEERKSDGNADIAGPPRRADQAASAQSGGEDR